MINYNNHNITGISYNNHSIKYVYGCGGNLVWEKSAETIYRWIQTDNVECVEETPSPTNIMFKAKYTNGYVYSVFCNEDTTLSSNYTQPNELMTEARIGTCITSIGTNAFYQCGNLINVDIPDSVTSIGNSAFAYDHSLLSVVIPNSVLTIGDYAFEGCSGLTNCTISSSVTSIGQSAFNGCESLTNIVLPNSLTTIGNFAFATCHSLTSITIPNSVTSIGNSAFAYDHSLTSVVIPNSVLTIGDRTFEGCRGLTSVTVNAATPPTLGNGVFEYTNDCPIYVPSQSVETYKAASGWSTYASRIQAITS